jgi:polysaccharide chain length determinant protein (PEP-CTERM system associated)
VGLLPGEGGGYFDRLQIELDELGVLEAELENAQSRQLALQTQIRGANPYVPNDEDSAASGTTNPVSEMDERILELETDLDELLLRFTEKHPDVVSTREQLARLVQRREEQIEMMRNASGEDTAMLANNPVYQQLSIALNEVDVEIAGLQSQIARERRKVAELQNKIDVIPAIEAQLTELTRDYDQVEATYDELRQLLEEEIIASRKQEAAVVNFRLIDPPYVSNRPVAPMREVILAAVLLFALGAGGALAWLLHLLKPIFHDVEDLRESTGLPVLGAVSMTWIDRHRSGRRRELLSFALVGSVLIASFMVVFVFRNPGGALLRQIVG